MSRKTLSALFLAQVRTLIASSLPSCIEYQFRFQREAILDSATSMHFEKGETPFLPVIPFTYRSFHDQMPMLEIDGKHGKQGLNDTCGDACIWKGTKYLHTSPRYIFKINMGEILNGKSISERINELREAGRRPLLTEEVIALCLHIKPKDVSLYCHIPDSNERSQRHLITGPGIDGLDGIGPEFFKGPTVRGLINDIHSPRGTLRIPSCAI